MLGGLYTLFATGLSLSAGVMRFVDIAHGDFIVLACYALLLLTTMLGLNPAIATLAVLPIAFAFGFGLQRFLLQHVVGDNVLLVILVTFALQQLRQLGDKARALVPLLAALLQTRLPSSLRTVCWRGLAQTRKKSRAVGWKRRRSPWGTAST